MAFKPPYQTPLTETQTESIAKISAIKTFLTGPKRFSLDIPKENQISSYDFLMFFGKSILGPAVIDLLIKKFLDTLFSNTNKKLENAIINSLAKSLDKNGKTIKTGVKNEDWLRQNVLPTFQISKQVLIGLIMRMIFGPRKKMSPNPVKAQSLYESSVCGGSGGFFSVSNIPNTPPGDVEYNKVQLQKQLAEGYVEFIISCQYVKIRLPENAEEQFGVNNPNINPADIFTNVNNYVTSEVQRINSPENKNAVNKSFLETSVDKSINLIGTAVEEQLGPVFLAIQQANPTMGGPGKTTTQYLSEEIVGTPCTIINSCSQNSPTHADKEKKSAFQSNLMNTIYALLISILFAEILKRVKQYIKQALSERLRRKAERRLKKTSGRFGSLDKFGSALNGAGQAKQALGSLTEINDFIKGA